MLDDMDKSLIAGVCILATTCALCIGFVKHLEHEYNESVGGLKYGYTVIYEGREATEAEVDMIQRNEDSFLYGYDDESKQVVVRARR